MWYLGDAGKGIYVSSILNLKILVKLEVLQNQQKEHDITIVSVYFLKIE